MPKPATVSLMKDPVFLVVGRDKPGSAEFREKKLQHHLRYVEQHYGRYLACGPIKNRDTGDVDGSFFLVAGENAEQVKELVSNDPYALCGRYLSRP